MPSRLSPVAVFDDAEATGEEIARLVPFHRVGGAVRADRGDGGTVVAGDPVEEFDGLVAVVPDVEAVGALLPVAHVDHGDAGPRLGAVHALVDLNLTLVPAVVAAALAAAFATTLTAALVALPGTVVAVRRTRVGRGVGDVQPALVPVPLPPRGAGAASVMAEVDLGADSRAELA